MELSEAVLNNILESIGQPALIFRRNHIQAANNLALCWLGYEQDELRQIPVLQLIRHNSRRKALAAYQSLFSRIPDEEIILQLCPADRRVCWGALAIRPASYAGEGTFLALIRDVTDTITLSTIDIPQLIEYLPIGIYRTLMDGTVVYANPALAHLIGFDDVETLMRYNVSEFYADPEERAQLISTYQHRVETYNNKLRWRRNDGTSIVVRSTGRIVRDANGQVLYMQGSLEDVTAYVQQAEHLQQRNQELEMLQNVALSLGQSLDLQETLGNILTQLKRVVPFDSASIFLRKERRLKLIAAKGLPPSIKARLLEKIEEFPLIQALTRIDSEHEIIIVPDIHKEASWQYVDDQDYLRSWIGVQLRYQGRVIGILNLDHTQANFYNETHAQLVTTLARQAALAIANAQLYEQAQQEIQQRKEAQHMLVHHLVNMETLYWVLRHLFEAQHLEAVLSDILNMLSATLEDTMLILVVFDPASGQLLHKFQSESQQEDIWKLFQSITGLTTLAPDTMPASDFSWDNGQRLQLEDGRYALGAVVRRRGLLAAVRYAGNTFDNSDIELLVTVANQLTIALESEQMYNQLHHRSQHLERLVDRRTRQLSIEQKRQEAILDATAEGIFYMENFRIQYANPAMCRMIGYQPEELVGQPLTFIRVAPEMPERPNFTDLLTDKLHVEPGRSETRLRRQDGSEFYASIRFSIVGQPGDDLLRMVAVVRDISQERELYFQRARFIANAAHELRTPLSSLMLRLHLMRRQPEKMPIHLDNFEYVLNYLKHLVEELLDLSRFERGTIKLDRNHFQLQTLIQQAADSCQPFAQQQQITLGLQLPEQYITVFVDGTRIVQLLENLIVNGINYNEPSGEVWVTTRLEEDLIGNRTVIIEVADDGIGIAPELLPGQIFEPFARPSEGTRRETGMGLALCREIVHLHSGTIYAHSTRGTGSSFHITLPIE